MQFESFEFLKPVKRKKIYTVKNFDVDFYAVYAELFEIYEISLDFQD